ncbi:aldehyde dehydrogenase family protein [Actinotalea sp.]|uniref:aldehyde dehydrogenase family protein n=1 Tax=Actinotalea sp. TaxID=1872145 RepID=UPI0035655FC5
MSTQSLFGESSLLGTAPSSVIGGEWSSAGSPSSTAVVDPATGVVLAEVPTLTPEDVARAVEVATAAQKQWRRQSHTARAAVLERVRLAIGEHASELAAIVTAEQGKSPADALGEIAGAQAFFDFAISQKYRTVGEVVAAEHGERIETREEPIGVIAAILPWNFPAAIFARKVAPALMAGNAIIVKPSELTPLSALALARVAQLAGLPDGLLNVVCGAGRVVGKALVTHPGIGMVTMTGSTRGGREILASTADSIIPVSLELGGKAPMIVFADADLKAAAAAAVEARLWNAGQVCTCNEVTYVHESVAAEFRALVVEAFRATVPGRPSPTGHVMGPLVAEREWVKVKEMVDLAVAQGATVEVGGGRPEGAEFAAGNWFAPTVLSGVTVDMDIAREEVFGPVLPLVEFSTDEEAIANANSSAYGLTAYVYTQDLNRAMRAVDDLEFGEVYLNKIGPEQVQGFHTGWKASGLGGDDGAHGYAKYVRHKTTYLGYGRGA